MGIQYVHLSDELCGQPEDFEGVAVVWIISDYTIGDYCGDGSSYARLADGRFVTMGHGHCSCYGPLGDDQLTQWELVGDKSDMLMHASGNDKLLAALATFGVMA